MSPAITPGNNILLAMENLKLNSTMAHWNKSLLLRFLFFCLCIVILLISCPSILTAVLTGIERGKKILNLFPNHTRFLPEKGNSFAVPVRSIFLFHAISSFNIALKMAIKLKHLQRTRTKKLDRHVRRKRISFKT